MILLYKGKCIRGLCGHYHGIVLLSPAVKLLMGILLSRLNAHIVDTVLTLSECGFRPNKLMIHFSQRGKSKRNRMNNNNACFRSSYTLQKYSTL